MVGEGGRRKEPTKKGAEGARKGDRGGRTGAEKERRKSKLNIKLHFAIGGSRRGKGEN